MKGLNDSKTDELLTLLEEQQEENETLQAQILEARQTVSLLSSQNSILRNELRKKSETIVSLNEQIGKLSESDLVLKRNEILKRQIIESRESVQSVRREAEIAVSTAEKKAESAIREARREYTQRKETLKSLEVELDERETAVSGREKKLEKEVERRSKQIIRDKLQTFETHYRRMRRGYSAFVFFTLSFATVMTMITAYRTEVFMHDWEKTIRMMVYVSEWTWARISETSSVVASLGRTIPQDTIAQAIHGILWVGVAFLLTGIVEIPLLLCLGLIIRHAKKEWFDDISVFVVLVELAFTFSFADEIKEVCDINLVLLILIVFVIYRGIRALLKKKIADSVIIRNHLTLG